MELNSLTQRIKCVGVESGCLRMFRECLVYSSMRLGVSFIAPRQLGAVGDQLGRQFLPSVVWCTGQSGAPPDSHYSCLVRDLLPYQVHPTVAPLGWLAHRTVRCTQPTVGAGHVSCVDRADDRWPLAQLAHRTVWFRRATCEVPQFRCTGLKNYLLYLLRWPRGGTVLARVVTRSSCTQKLISEEYDSWAWVPMLETGPLFSAEMERRTTTGGGLLFAWRFAFPALGDPHTSCMTCGPGPPCHRLGCLGARRARFLAASRGVSGGVFLGKGFSSRAVVTLSHFLQLQRPFAFEFSAPLCIHTLPLFVAVVAMASLVHPERFQSEVALNLVRNLLGWSTLAFAGRIRVGATLLGDLAVGEFVLFISCLSCGLALPISPFFLLLLEEFELQLQHLTPHSILQAAIFAHLCEIFVGVAPALPSSVISSCWLNLGSLETILVPTIFKRGRIRPCPTSPPSAAQGGRTGAPTR
jgi:hypothetical protein